MVQVGKDDKKMWETTEDDNKKELLDIDEENLREERRRTGKYVATGTAIFLSLLGIYQALARGNPEYAALFIPALCLFLYVFWKIYWSKRRRCRALKLVREAEMSTSSQLNEVIVDSLDNEPFNNTTREKQDSPKLTNVISDQKCNVRIVPVYNRSYSVA